jgi:hypothetical protein
MPSGSQKDKMDSTQTEARQAPERCRRGAGAFVEIDPPRDLLDFDHKATTVANKMQLGKEPGHREVQAMIAHMAELPRHADPTARRRATNHIRSAISHRNPQQAERQ